MTTLALNDRLSPDVGLSFAAAGGQTDFAADFPLIYDAAGNIDGLFIRRVRAGVVAILAYPADFSVTGITANAFTARLLAPSTAGDLVQVYSELPAQRDRQHVFQGQIRTDTLEGDADNFEGQLQELRRDVRRAIKAPLGGAPTDLDPARANQAAAFDAAGNLVAVPAGQTPFGLAGFTDLNANAVLAWGGRYWCDTAGAPITLTLPPLALAPATAVLEIWTGDSADFNNVTVAAFAGDQLSADGQIGVAAVFSANVVRLTVRKLGGLARVLES